MELRRQAVIVSGLNGQQTDLRFELFDWLKSKNLSVNEAVALLELTGNQIKRSVMDEKL